MGYVIPGGSNCPALQKLLRFAIQLEGKLHPDKVSGQARRPQETQERRCRRKPFKACKNRIGVEKGKKEHRQGGSYSYPGNCSGGAFHKILFEMHAKAEGKDGGFNEEKNDG